MHLFRAGDFAERDGNRRVAARDAGIILADARDTSLDGFGMAIAARAVPVARDCSGKWATGERFEAFVLGEASVRAFLFFGRCYRNMH